MPVPFSCPSSLSPAKFTEPELRIPCVADLNAAATGIYNAELVARMESALLDELGWKLFANTPAHFLEAFSALAPAAEAAAGGPGANPKRASDEEAKYLAWYSHFFLRICWLGECGGAAEAEKRMGGRRHPRPVRRPPRPDVLACPSPSFPRRALFDVLHPRDGCGGHHALRPAADGADPGVARAPGWCVFVRERVKNREVS